MSIRQSIARYFRGFSMPSGYVLGRTESGDGPPHPIQLSTMFNDPRYNGGGGPSTPVPVGANPTATAGPTAVNGSATTFLRSDGAPAVQIGSASQKGLLQVDGTTITAASGIISASAGGLGVAPFHPGYQAGRFYYPPWYTATVGTVAINQNTIYASPFYVGATHTFTGIGLYTSGTASGKFAELGIYANSNGAPGALILDAGEISLTAAGALVITISQSLSPGWYWLAQANNSGAGGIAVYGGNEPFGSFMEGNSTFSNVANGQAATVAWVFSTGNLPNPFGTVTWVNGTHLLMVLEG